MTKLILIFCLSGAAFAQAPAPAKPEAAKPAPAKPPMSPESKDLIAATQEKDNAKRLAALEKFLKDYPNSASRDLVHRELVVALVQKSPKAASKWIKNFEKTAGADERAPVFRQYAGALLTQRKNLGEAQKYAERAVGEFTWEMFLEAQKERAKARNIPVRPESALRQQHRSTSLQMKDTLGQVYVARRKWKQAEAVMGEVVKSDPTSASAAMALGEIAQKKKKADEALKWFAQAALARPNKESKEKLASTYSKIKGGTAGIEEFLDTEYKRLFPVPVHAEPYQKSANRSQRVVLAEVYTGAGCPPCVAADLAFDVALERYRREDVAVVMYHEHIPRPDPMTNADTIARWKFQQGQGVPTYGIDGEMIQRGGGSRDMTAEIEKIVRAAIDKQLEKAPEATLELRAVNDGNTVRATAKANGAGGKDAALKILLLEKVVRYSGENGIRFHPMVVRGVASFDAAGGEVEKSHEFRRDTVAEALRKHLDDFEKFDERHNKDGKFRFAERKDSVDWSNVAVVAFVQDVKTKKVLQAAWADAPVRR